MGLGWHVITNAAICEHILGTIQWCVLAQVCRSGRGKKSQGLGKRYLVPGLGVTSIDLSVGHLIRLLVHPSRAAEDVLLQVWDCVQNDTRLGRLPAIQVVDDCNRTSGVGVPFSGHVSAMSFVLQLSLGKDLYERGR